jgi:hypothetical protein
VSVPTGASMVSVVDGLLRICALPPFTLTDTLSADAEMYCGRALVDVVTDGDDDADVFQCIVNVTGICDDDDGCCGFEPADGVSGTGDVEPLPEHPATRVQASTKEAGPVKPDSLVRLPSENMKNAP